MKFKCWRCKDSKWQHVELADGTTAAKRCKCARRFANQKALKLIPPHFGSPKLNRLEPRAELHNKQEFIIKRLKENPEKSFLFAGRNGVGKTHFAWALYRYALATRRRVVACTMRELLAEFRELELSLSAVKNDDTITIKTPRLYAESLKCSERWFIFIDEFEKARPTEFASETLLAVLDVILQYGHQLIVTSNLPVTDERANQLGMKNSLRSHWGRIDEIWGNSIVRRLEACTLVDLF